jgi:hypothetical protein
MRATSLSEELDSITKDYDFGIVPGSAAIFVKDEENYLGRLDLTILEGILVIIEVDDQGYKVRYCYSEAFIDGVLAMYLCHSPLVRRCTIWCSTKAVTEV